MSERKPVSVQLGPRQWELGAEYLKILEPCNHCLEADDIGAALRKELDDKGYVYLRRVLPEDDVLKARLAVLEYIHEQGTFTDDGRIPCMEGSNDITNHPAVANVIENPYLYHIFTCIFHGVTPVTFDYKWLRGMHEGGNTGCHLDRVYMNQGSPDLLTCWIPFDHLTLDMSVLAVLEGSHRMDRTEKDAYTKLQHTYADLDVDRDRLQGTGWFTNDPMEFYRLNGQQAIQPSDPVWKTTDFSAGDILIFTMRTIHMSSVNCTKKIRLSCDTRWQPSNQPGDPRFIRLERGALIGHGERKFGLHAKKVDDDQEEKTTMDQWRQRWGFSPHAEITLF